MDLYKHATPIAYCETQGRCDNNISTCVCMRGAMVQHWSWRSHMVTMYLYMAQCVSWLVHHCIQSATHVHVVCEKGTLSSWVYFTRLQFLNEDQFFSTVFHLFQCKLAEHKGSVVMALCIYRGNASFIPCQGNSYADQSCHCIQQC